MGIPTQSNRTARRRLVQRLRVFSSESGMTEGRTAPTTTATSDSEEMEQDMDHPTYPDTLFVAEFGPLPTPFQPNSIPATSTVPNVGSVVRAIPQLILPTRPMPHVLDSTETGVRTVFLGRDLWEELQAVQDYRQQPAESPDGTSTFTSEGMNLTTGQTTATTTTTTTTPTSTGLANILRTRRDNDDDPRTTLALSRQANRGLELAVRARESYARMRRRQQETERSRRHHNTGNGSGNGNGTGNGGVGSNGHHDGPSAPGDGEWPSQSPARTAPTARANAVNASFARRFSRRRQRSSSPPAVLPLHGPGATVIPSASSASSSSSSSSSTSSAAPALFSFGEPQTSFRFMPLTQVAGGTASSSGFMTVPSDATGSRGRSNSADGMSGEGSGEGRTVIVVRTHPHPTPFARLRRDSRPPTTTRDSRLPHRYLELPFPRPGVFSYSNEKERTLPFGIVYTDGGEYSTKYGVRNVLRDDLSVYCTVRNVNVNIMFRYNGEERQARRLAQQQQGTAGGGTSEPLPLLSSILIKAPQRGFTSPVRDGLVFISNSPIDIFATSRFDDFDQDRFERYKALKRRRRQYSSTGEERMEYVTPSPSSRDIEPIAYFSLDKTTHYTTHLRLPNRPGRYILIKLLHGSCTNDNIDLQYVGFAGAIGPKAWGEGSLL